MKASFEKLREDSIVFFTLHTYCRLTETDSSRDGGGGDKSGPERTAEIQPIVVSPGLSLRGEGRGFPSATRNVAPGYFHRKIEEK